MLVWTVDLVPIFSGFVFLLAPRPFTFDLWVRFISTPNLPVSVLQESLRAGCGTYKDHQTCRRYCSILHGSWTLANQDVRTVEECTECYLGSGWYGRTYSLNTKVQDSHYVSQVMLLLRASWLFLLLMVVFENVVLPRSAETCAAWKLTQSLLMRWGRIVIEYNTILDHLISIKYWNTWINKYSCKPYWQHLILLSLGNGKG